MQEKILAAELGHVAGARGRSDLLLAHFTGPQKPGGRPGRGDCDDTGCWEGAGRVWEGVLLKRPGGWAGSEG